MSALSGSCACGAVRFTASGEAGPAKACHCTTCRKQSGHYWVAVSAVRADISVTGAEYVRWFKATDEARRGFCELCGSTLFWEKAGSDRMSFSAGALDGETGLRLAVHIYLAEKGDYYDISDSVPCFAGSDVAASKEHAEE
ncbi:GFA family protein [Afifella sp. IM 167]|uniref:GFA family protein n=1 Tax=Afifella sp. IM 167 TaxID=2033586 RepID=UPI001CD01247|nr:GFA family protein [Afifella sp. IM 167]MBZ8134189.1 aldehyde-activating protein [Afifella sp. IM 167]